MVNGSPSRVETTGTDVAANVARVRERIARAAARVGRRPDQVTLVAVSKTVDVARIRAAVAAGVSHIGENRVQEAQEKHAVLADAGITWHLVGHLQRNKAKAAAHIFDVIHSVDGVPVAEELARRAVAARRTVDVLVEVNIGAEPQKFGVLPENAAALVEVVARLEGLRLRGLMAIPPVAGDAEGSRPFFQALRGLRDDLVARGAADDLPELSMGMTDDFEVAIEEGATIVRVGRAIFGERPLR